MTINIFSRKMIYSIFKKDSGIIPFILVLLFQCLAFGFYKGVQDNYLAEIVHVDAFNRGLLEFFREMPGLLLIFILALLYRFSEVRILKLGMLIMLCGSIALALISGGIGPAFLFITMYSLGDHMILPLKSTISMSYAKEEHKGESLGFMNSIVNAGNVIGLLSVSLIFLYFRRRGISASLSSFRTIFVLSTLLMVIALLISIRMSEKGIEKGERQRLYFNRKYTKFYMLEIFYGARKQIFLTFAPYVIILHYGADTTIISLLLALSALLSVFFSPLIGKLIDRLGYKTVMVSDTLILIVVCFFYGFSHRLFSPNVAFLVVCANYIFDTILSLCSMATNVYAGMISDSNSELISTITTGISVNHLISILIALFGGLIWQRVGIELLFSLSAFLGLMNSLFALTVPSPRRMAKVKA